MASDAAIALLVARYQQIIIDLAKRNAAIIGALWDRLGGLDEATLDSFASQAATIVGAAQFQAAAISVAYINGVVAFADQQGTAEAIDIAAVVANARNGTPLSLVYSRPTITARGAIADGKSFADAMKLARERAVSAANTDVHLSARLGANTAMKAHKIRYYRRVPDPTACAFCLTASTQRYSTGDLMPLHAYCGCSVMPLIGASEHIIDPDLLARLKASTGRSDYWNDPAAATAVRDHGELGPVLVHAGDNFAAA